MSEENLDLTEKKCEPCSGNALPMIDIEAQKMLKNLNEGWAINPLGHLERVFLVKNFVKALELANKFGDIAEEEGHHPDLLVSYGKLRVEIWTHKIAGLALADFILAAKLDALAHKILSK